MKLVELEKNPPAWLIAVSVAGLLVVIAGGTWWHIKSKEEQAQLRRAQAEFKMMEQGFAAPEITAIDLWTAYSGNEVAADQRYAGKVIAVAGTVQSVSRNAKGEPFVLLAASDSGQTYVQCFFSHAAEDSLTSIAPGANGRIKGAKGL